MKVRPECRHRHCDERPVISVRERRTPGHGHGDRSQMWDGTFCGAHFLPAFTVKLKTMDKRNYLEVRKI